MKYINTFKTHASYEEKLSGGGVDISLPNVSYCEDVKDVNFNPYNTVEFYVGEITEPQTVSIYTDATNHVDVTVSEVNKWYSYLLPKDKGLCSINGNLKIWDYDNTIKKVIVKANISYYSNTDLSAIISYSTVEASFKGSDTSNVTDMKNMFSGCENLTSLDVSSFNTSNVTNMAYMFSDDSGLTSLDLSNFDTSKVTNMGYMFYACKGLTSLNLSGWDMSNVTNTDDMLTYCSNLSTIKMVGCNQTTIDKIKAVKPSGARIVTE